METLDDYLTKLASASPVPGGGSAAMFVASVSAALLAMVCRITGKDAAERIASQADALRESFVAARSLDETAFQAVVTAQKLPKRNDEERTARTKALQSALQRAAEVPLRGSGDVVTLLQLIDEAIDVSSAGLRSDLGCAAEFGGAAVAACAYNVQINHKYVNDSEIIRQQGAELKAIEQRSALLVQKIRLRLAAN